MHKTNNRIIFGLSIPAAAWMITGSDILLRLGLNNEKIIEILTYAPALGVVFLIAKGRPGFIACERRTFKRILGIK